MLCDNLLRQRNLNQWKVSSGVLSLSLSLLRDCRLHRPELHKSANFINSLRVTIACAITVVNVFITAFDSRIAIRNPLEEVAPTSERN